MSSDVTPAPKEPTRNAASTSDGWEFVQDDADARRGVARVLTSRNELVCETTPERADLIVCAVNYMTEGGEWLTPFEGSGVEWHESLPSPYTYQQSDFSKLVAAVHEYECAVLEVREQLHRCRADFHAKVLALQKQLGDLRRKPKPDGGHIHA